MTRYTIRADRAPWENTTMRGTLRQACDLAHLIAEEHGGQVSVIDHERWHCLHTVQG